MSEPTPLHALVLDWYAGCARDLPWRRPGVSPWAVLVSEVMLQQTPVARVLPVWQAWVQRWPTASALAGEPAGEAVRAWGRLGYPRRALRLHASAVAIRDLHDGAVPATEAELLTLPGVGTYTAAAVAAFAFGERTTVVDTNVRRVLARVVEGRAQAAPAVSRDELRLATSLLPAGPGTASTWNVALMELGALVCTARSPRCGQCPAAQACAWQRAGRPAYQGPARRAQRWAGTDRQVRGALLDVLRGSDRPVPRAELGLGGDDLPQRERCLASLVADGLVQPLPDGRVRLPA